MSSLTVIACKGALPYAEAWTIWGLSASMLPGMSHSPEAVPTTRLRPTAIHSMRALRFEPTSNTMALSAPTTSRAVVFSS